MVLINLFSPQLWMSLVRLCHVQFWGSRHLELLWWHFICWLLCDGVCRHDWHTDWYGCILVKLPWHRGHHRVYKITRNWLRFDCRKNLNRRLTHEPELQVKYDSVIQNMWSSGIVEEVLLHEQKVDRPIFCMPHWSLLRETRKEPSILLLVWLNGGSFMDQGWYQSLEGIRCQSCCGNTDFDFSAHVVPLLCSGDPCWPTYPWGYGWGTDFLESLVAWSQVPDGKTQWWGGLVWTISILCSVMAGEVANPVLIAATPSENVFRVERWGYSSGSMGSACFIFNSRHKQEDRRLGDVSYDEMQHAGQVLIQQVQQEFAVEVGALQQGHLVVKSSPLARLTPYLDDEGLLRVQGRLQFSSLPPDEKHPILILKSHFAVL